MRIPRVQFRIRTLVVLVFVVGLITGAGIQGMRWSRLASEYRQRANIHRAEATWFDTYLTTLYNNRASHLESLNEVRASSKPEIDRKLLSVYESLIRVTDGLISKISAHADYCRSLHRKYDRAARYPWLAVAPDPPRPR